MSSSLAVQRVLIYYDDESARRATVIRQLLTNRLTTSSRFWGMCYELLDIVNTDVTFRSRLIIICCRCSRHGILHMAEPERLRSGLIWKSF